MTQELSSIDGALLLLVNVENARTERQPANKRQPVTLFVKGLIVTGDLIPGWQYMRDLAQPTESDDNTGMFTAWAESMMKNQAIRAELDEKDPEELTDEERELLEDLPNFVHLANAQWVAPSGMQPSNQGVLTRIRFTSIDGWTLGRMSATPPTS